MNAALAAFKLAFQLSPIILVDGIAASIPGTMLPIIAITESLNFAVGLLSGGENLELDDFFANFEPMPGGTIIDNQVGHYPFANQAVAANAIIKQPFQISMRMICPVREPFGYATKLATMTALQAALDKHNNSGGTYTIATPAFFYTNCIMTGMRDASSQDSRQAQNAWQLDFEQPLITQVQADQAQNALMSRMSAGTPFDGPPTWSGLAPNVGTTAGLIGSSVVPAASGAAGAGVAGLRGTFGS